MRVPVWENEEEEKAFLKEREPREAVRRLFGNYLDRALNRLEHKFRKPAITALTFLVTSSGTRNIVSEDDLLGNVVHEDHLTQPDAREVLNALSSTTRLVFRHTRGESAFYEISSEFLIPWITEKRQAREKDAQLEKQREELAREEEKRLHEAESERVKLLLEKRKRERIFGVTVFLLGIIMLIALAALSLVSIRAYRLSKQNAADLNAQVHQLVEKGRIFRENAKSVLASGTDNPLKDVTALRNLALALDSNPRDTEAARLASNLLLQHVWCPPAAPAVTYRKDALLAATFVPGGSHSEIFAMGGDGQLLFWNGERSLSPTQSLFEKPKPYNPQQIVQQGFASFSPDGRWLLIIPPTLLLPADDGESAVQGAPPQRAPPAGARSGRGLCKIQIWRWSMQNRTYESTGEELEIQRLRGSRISFAWSNELDRLVIVNVRGSNEAECAFFQVEGTFQELVDRSKRFTDMKIVALAFATYHSGIAAVSVDPEKPALRKVVLFSLHGDYIEVISVSGKDSIRLSEGFQPDRIAFGPGNDEITLMSWNSVRTLNIRDGKVTPIPPPTFRDQSQSIRLVVGPGVLATRLVATSLYGRVEVANAARMQYLLSLRSSAGQSESHSSVWMANDS